MSETPELNAPRQVLLPGRRSLLVRLTAQEGMRAALLDVLNTYTDGVADNAHRGSTGFATLMEALPPLLDGPPAVLRMEPLRISMQETALTEDWSF